MKRRAGFTLIELVVIIMILGILAGVAAPKLLKTSGSAVDNGLKQSLQIVRDAIDMYMTENNGVYPPCSGNGADFRLALEKFVRGDFPVSPVGVKNNEVAAATPAAADNSTGWMYDPTTGAFICNSTDPSLTSGVNYAQF